MTKNVGVKNSSRVTAAVRRITHFQNGEAVGLAGADSDSEGGMSVFYLVCPSGKAADGVRHIRLLQCRDFFRRKLDIQRGDGIFQMVRLGGSYNRRGDDGFGQQPGQGDLRPRNTMRARNFADFV